MKKWLLVFAIIGGLFASLSIVIKQRDEMSDKWKVAMANVKAYDEMLGEVQRKDAAHQLAIRELKTYQDSILRQLDATRRELKVKDKDWYTVKYGYFVLVSNIDTSPKDLLSDYFGRTDIEVVFKTAKEYLDLLPLSKWTDSTVRGKILHDIIDTTALLLLRKSMRQSGMSTSEIIGRCQSLMCCRKKDGTITVETPRPPPNTFAVSPPVMVTWLLVTVPLELEPP
jgi:transposase